MKERRPVAWYPPLVAAYPVLALYAANLSLFPLPYLWRPLLVSLLVACVLWGVAALLTRSWVRGALVSSLAIAAFHTYRAATGFVPSFWGASTVLISWLVCLAIVLGIGAWIAPKVTKPLNVLCTALVVLAVGQIASGTIQSRQSDKVVTTGAAKGERPDVFYVILDGYGRSDSIRQAIGYDNTPFVKELERRGFYVAPESHANYCQTELSVGSSLNMDFIPKLLPQGLKDELDRSPLANLVNDNAVSRRFRELGYQYIAVPSGFPAFTFRTADLVAQGTGRMSLLEATLLDRTPVVANAQIAQSMYDERRTTLLDALGQLRQLGQRGDRPRFVLAHILMPHPPFVFDADGGKVRHDGAYGLFDGSDYMAFAGTPASYRSGYAGQLQYLNKQLLTVLDNLLGQPGPKPIIILQGDHGSKVGLDQNSLAKTDLGEVFPILNAYRVPPEMRSQLTPDITPVNTFRTLFRSQFGDQLPNLPNQSWYSPYANPFEFTDVTSKVSSVAPKP